MKGYHLKFSISPAPELVGEECEVCGAPHGEHVSRVIGDHLEWACCEPGTLKRRGVNRLGIPCTWGKSRQVNLTDEKVCQTCVMMAGRVGAK